MPRGRPRNAAPTRRDAPAMSQAQETLQPQGGGVVPLAVHPTPVGKARIRFGGLRADRDFVVRVAGAPGTEVTQPTA